ncbi:MAG: O-antigen ligase family protein [Candidatus Omnitrophica bacterium]|nr:O-antigen ligase family protein [Candidatus Omnitrophota bacterium]
MIQNIFLTALLSLIALRLGIWKLFPAMEFSIKDEFSNMIIAGLIFAVALAFYGLKCIRREALGRSGFEGPLALLLIAAAVSMPWTADVSSSVSAMIVLVAYILFFHMLFETLLYARSRQIFLWFFAACSLVVALIGINDIIYLSSVPAQEIENARLTNESLYYILINKRACSLLGWPNVLAGFLMLGMPVAAGLFVIARQWALKVLCIISAAVMLTAFFFTYSFLGWSVFLFTATIMVFILWRSGFLRIPPKMGPWVMAGIFLLMVLFSVVVIRKNFASSISPRKEYARVVASVITEHPWRGVGFGAYRAASLKFVDNREGLTGFAHNAYLQIWAEAGIAALIAVIWLLFLMARGSWRAWLAPGERDHKLMLAVVVWGMLAFLIDNLNSFTMLKPNSSFFFWTWLAVVASFIYRTPPVCARWLALAFLPVCIVGIFLSARCAGYLNWLQKSVQAVNAGQLKEGRAAMAHGQALNPLDVRVWTALGMSYLQEFQRTQERSALERAQAAFERAAKIAPNFYHSFLILSRIHAFKGDMLQASALQQRAIAISPYETQRDLLLSQGAQR